jgi:hypothetical protein
VVGERARQPVGLSSWIYHCGCGLRPCCSAKLYDPMNDVVVCSHLEFVLEIGSFLQTWTWDYLDLLLVIYLLSSNKTSINKPALRDVDHHRQDHIVRW